MAGLTIGIVAGEASGDNLGAALIEALRERVPELRVVGVAGPKMRAAGCETLADSEELAVMGLTEILRHLPRLFALRSRLRESFVALRPQVFVGIDSPEFNLGLARQLKGAGLRTVQYVSPQVWAWRQGRVRTIGRAVDLVLCLLPFEPRFYGDHGVRALFVGHPLADRFPLAPDDWTEQQRAVCWRRLQSGWHRPQKRRRRPALLPCSAALLSQTICATDCNRGSDHACSWRRSSGLAPRYRGRAGRTSGRRD